MDSSQSTGASGTASVHIQRYSRKVRPSSSVVLALALWTVLLATPESPALAQSPDSLQLLRRAREAQQDFERGRRSNLPYEFDERSGPCDVRIGRFCYWDDPSPDRPPEPEDIGRARDRLLRELAAAGAKLPGDDWILGQRVRYLVEQRRVGLAVTLSQTCGATRWWCDALEGFARHSGGDYEGADRAFARALAAMDEKQRCDWIDLSPLLEDAKEYRKLGCAERVKRGRRIWWLADPLYSLEGNDLRTEHYARHTLALLMDDASNPYGLVWGDDMRELLIRFGWPTHWSRTFRRSGSLEPPTIVGHEADPGFWFFQRPVLTAPWSDVTEVHWEPRKERTPAQYAPPYAAALVPITGVQFARFRRGDSALTVAAVDLSADSGFAAGPIDVRLAAARDPATPVEVGRASLASPFGLVAVRSSWRPALLSLEIMKGDTGLLGWHRVMLPRDPAGLPPVLSDILLLAPRRELPRTLDEAVGAALRPAEVRKGQRVGLYWEMYEVPDSALEVAVTVTKARSKRDSPFPVGRPECPPRVSSLVSVRWQEARESQPRGAARSIVLDLRELSRGRYLVAIQISQAGQPRGCSSRELEIVKDGKR